MIPRKELQKTYETHRFGCGSWSQLAAHWSLEPGPGLRHHLPALSSWSQHLTETPPSQFTLHCKNIGPVSNVSRSNIEIHTVPLL